MSSIQSHILRMLMHLQQWQQRKVPVEARTYAEERLEVDNQAASYALPEDIEYQIIEIADGKAAWAKVAERNSEQVVLYFHGGAYVTCSMFSYRFQQVRV